MINTFDVDHKKYPSGFIVSSDELLQAVLKNVSKCPKAGKVSYRQSSGGDGYHVRVECSEQECGACRLVFDSPLRFSLDLRRPWYSRDVLFDEKMYKKGGKFLQGRAGEWIDGSLGTRGVDPNTEENLSFCEKCANPEECQLGCYPYIYLS